MVGAVAQIDFQAVGYQVGVVAQQHVDRFALRPERPADFQQLALEHVDIGDQVRVRLLDHPLLQRFG